MQRFTGAGRVRVRMLVGAAGAVVGCGSDPPGTAGPHAGRPVFPDGTVMGEDGGVVAPAKPVDPKDPTTPEAQRPLVVQDLVIEEVAAFQGVKISLAKGGVAAAKRNAPLVARRPALIRVYVAPGEAFKPRELQAELRIETESTRFPLHLQTMRVAKASTEAELTSTFNFDVPEDEMIPEARFSVVIRDTAQKLALGTKVEGGARWPVGANERASLAVDAASTVVKIKLVPVRYDADRSGRVPDVSAAMVEKYREAAYKLYPTAKVDISVREPLPWTRPIAATDGNGWSNVLQGVLSARARDGADDDVYYYGVFNPAASTRDFCRAGCILGLSSLVEDARDASLRGSVGLGFSGQEMTMVHEVGHAQGRKHSPCGRAAGPDPDFPYTGGGIGVWGWDLVQKKLVAPTAAKDFMGYCDPNWVSDYVYALLFERIAEVNTTANARTSGLTAAAHTYRFVTVSERGELSWGDTLTVREALHSAPHALTYTDANGRATQVTGHFYPYEDLGGGYWLVPEPDAQVRRVTFASRPQGVRMATELAR